MRNVVIIFLFWIRCRYSPRGFGKFVFSYVTWRVFWCVACVAAPRASNSWRVALVRRPCQEPLVRRCLCTWQKNLSCVCTGPLASPAAVPVSPVNPPAGCFLLVYVVKIVLCMYRSSRFPGSGSGNSSDSPRR